jgi:Histone methylation protein DOT1
MNGIIGAWQGSIPVDTSTNIIANNVVVATDTEEFSPFVVGCDPLSSFQCLVSQGYHARKDMTYLADMLPPPPPPMSGRDDNNDDHRERVDAIMQTYWRPNDGFFGSSSSIMTAAVENKEYDDDHAALTYGEVTSLGCRQLAYAMNIHQSSSNNNDVVFVDLGSGVGRLVTQMYLDHYPFHRIQKAVGVELSQERHDIAIRALQSIIEQELVGMGMRRTNHHIEMSTTTTTTTEANPTELPQSSSSYTVSKIAIELIRGDAVEYLQSTTRSDGITHVYMSSLCFPDHVLEKLQRLLLQQQQSFSSSSSSSLQVVAALNRLDLFHQDSATWQETEVPIQMSWGPGVVKVYHRRRRPGQTRPDPTRPEQLE